MCTDEALESINLLLNVIQSTMGLTKCTLGFDLKEKKLVVLHLPTNKIAKIDLEELYAKAFSSK